MKMLSRSGAAFGLIVSAICFSAAATADDAFFRVPLADIPAAQKYLSQPEDPEGRSRRAVRENWQWMEPYAVLDGEGEVYVVSPSGQWTPWSRTPNRPWTGELVIRGPKGKGVSGRLFLPKPDWKGMTVVEFSLPASAAGAEAREPFYRGKIAHYERLMSQGTPGAAWFRHQVRTAQLALKITPATATERPAPWQPNRTNDLVETYDLFTGGRAMSENLQFDRVLPRVQPNETPVKLDSLSGISIQEIDWQPLVKDLRPKLDPLASRVPADQHVVFLPSFQAAVALADETGAHDTPVLRMAQPRSENTRVVERYQEQLGLPMSQLARLVGPHVAKSVALTGSDPFFPTGTDVAVLFEAPQPAVLEQLLLARIALAGATHKDAARQQGEVNGLAYRGLRSPDRSISSYVAKLEGAVVVTNSLYQLGRLAAVRKGEAKSIASLPEYVFFRNRYRLGDSDETAMLFLSDPTIRRWCGPRWRIADSRRTRVAAVMAELQASQLDKLVRGQAQAGPIHTDLSVPEAGEWSLTPAGVVSAKYGSLRFMTPIGEVPLEEVTKAEADAYGRWRDGYQRNWNWAFDPIALRISLGKQSVSADMTVMPLIVATKYRELVSLSQGASLPADAGDRHDALAHFLIALNRKSPLFTQAETLASGLARGASLSWVGQTVEIYADDDPFWKDLAQQKEPEINRFMQEALGRMPVAVRIESTGALRLAAFLTGLRAFVEQTAPGLTRWESLTYHEHPYVKITPKEPEKSLPADFRNLAIYYAALPDSLTVTLNESLLKRALDRSFGREKAKSEGQNGAKGTTKPDTSPKPLPLPGANVALLVDRKILEVTNALARDQYQAMMQASAWGNLPILNEWRRAYPDRDPVEVHRRLWNAELVCPGGGRFVWNEKYGTMESTVYGHPAEPKLGPAAPPVLSKFQNAAFGLSFEHQGLRARATLHRDAKESAERSPGIRAKE